MGSREADAAAGPTRQRWLPSTGQAAAVAAALLATYAAMVFTGWPSRHAVESVTDVAFPAMSLFYVPLAALAARSARGRLRAAWAAMTVAFGLWAIGEVLWSYYKHVIGEVPFPSWADAAYLAYIPGLVAGLLLFPTTRTRHQGRLVLDGLLMTGSLFLISWLTVLRDLWHAGDGRQLAFVLSLAYPAGDVLILTVGLMTLVRAPAGLRAPLSLLVAGLVCSALGNGIWTYLENTAGYRIGGLADVFYGANALLTIVALVAGNRARADAVVVNTAPSWLSLWLPLVPLAAAGIFVLATDRDVAMESPVIITCVLLVMATVARQLLETAELVRTARQNQRLADRLTDELAGASAYVASILPTELSGPVVVSSRYLPSRAVGGDCFGYTWIDDDHLVVYLIDVSGHGVRPALLSVSVHNLLRSGALPKATLLAPDEVLAELNTRFGMESHDDHYSTMWYGVYQLSTHQLRYANAGHPPPLMLTGRPGAVDCVPLDGAALPLGMFASTEATVRTVAVAPGSRILVYSDGALGDRALLADFIALCATLAAAGTDWLDSLVGRLPVGADGVLADDCSLVLLTFGE